jgi:hypothetical protein
MALIKSAEAGVNVRISRTQSLFYPITQGPRLTKDQGRL